MRKILTLLLLISLLVALPLAAASREPVRARQAMVASTSPLASQIGVDVMRRGGTAVDAAIAVGFALAVTWPSAGNLGGGGFMLIRRADGRAEVIDYRERAPRTATKDMYLDAQGNATDASRVGHRAAGVPGTVAGLALAHERHGRLPWRDLVEPARKLAADGFEVDFHLARSLSAKDNAGRLERFDESRRIFLRDGNPYRQWERFVQPELAATLSRVRDKGIDDFYRGKTAQLIVEEIKRGGGIVTMQDLAEYEPVIRTPLRGTYRGYEILTMPPPSSGGTALIEMLNMLETQTLRSDAFQSAAAIHLQTEVQRRAFADRTGHLGDTDFVKGVPIGGLVSKRYATSRFADFDATHATASESIAPGEPAAYESPETTHYTIIDAEGTIVSNTYTLNDSYGNAVTVRGAGFLLNDEMDDFTAKPGSPNLYDLVQGDANAIAPRKRPLSSMTPAIVLRDGKPFLAVGSSGGPKIITTVLQILIAVIDYGRDLQEAVDAPRFHHQWKPDAIYWEPRGVNEDTRRKLEQMGHVFREKPEFTGNAQAIMIEPGTGVRIGASDPRFGGIPCGY
ncbi:MAG: gamma-glutamyltransferase [Thermoanaerobaculia bacterium]